ncbi:MAG TPA: DUF2306 domain-containing protein [Vicinamibacterales bacterium]|nr:DUF2306 domain-containing protein [Vicinamibacterales bacterium]
MTTAPNTSTLAWPARPKYVVFGFIAVMMVIVLYRDRVLLDPAAPIWEHYRFFRWWLLPHGLAGALALFLGPLQFSSRLRRRVLRWHRLIGRTYVCGVAVAVPIGTLIEYVKYVHGIATLRLLVGSFGFGGLWALTTGVGFAMVKRRRIQTHQRWMTRSYAVALVFLANRCIDQIPWLAKLWEWPSTLLETHHVSDMWLVIALSLVGAEVIIRSQDYLERGRRVAALRASPASA